MQPEVQLLHVGNEKIKDMHAMRGEREPMTVSIEKKP
jgi:hypothetical protein